MSIRDDMVQKVLGNPGKYSIQQLQAAMKSGSLPAYVVVPIIQDKVQQQKQMQAAMQQQQPPQSTIAEQVMQEADQMGGVAQLPTNLPQEYAQGGIVAFDEGGEVKRYAPGGNIEDVELELNRDEAIEALRKAGKLTKATLADLASFPGRMTLSSIENIIGKPLRAVGVPFPMAPKEVYGGDREAFLPRTSAFYRQEEEARRSPAMFPTDDRAAAAAVQSALTDVGGVGTGAGAGPGAGAAPAGVAGLGIGDFKRKSAVDEHQRMMYGTETEPGLVARSAARQRELDEKIEAQKVPGLAYEGMEKALQKEEQARGVEKNEAKYTAMIKAGLAMMAGTSRHAFENIGKGALVGIDDWQKAAQDIKKAEKEHRMMMAQIEQARRAEKIGDRDRMISRLESASKHAQRMDELGVAGYMRAFGVDQDAAQDAWGKRFSAATQLQIARDKGEVSTLLGLMRMGGAGEKGAMTTLQRGNVMRELENSKPVLDYIAQLRKERGSQITDDEIAKAKRIKVLQEFEKYYGSSGAPSAARTGFTPEEIEYLKQQGISHYFAGLK